MKTCRRCQDEKEDELFGKSSKNRDGLHSWCKECTSKARMRRYYENREAERANGNRRNQAARLAIKQKTWDYLKLHPCVDCGEDDPIVLDFDHIDPSKKEVAISVLTRATWKWEKVLEEIAKCEVRCANCHRKRTAGQFNWFVGITP